MNPAKIAKPITALFGMWTQVGITTTTTTTTTTV